MGKRFVTRSRQEWEALLQPGLEDEKTLESSATAWLLSRLEGYVQSNPDAPITLAVPDRFEKILGETPAKTAVESLQTKV